MWYRVSQRNTYFVFTAAAVKLRQIRSGAFTAALVTIPIKVYPAAESHSIFLPAVLLVDPIQIGASYSLAAEGVAAKPYELLRRALERSSKVAVAKFAMRDRERLGLLRVMDRVIVLHGLRWPDEIRSASQADVPDATVSEKEVDAAVALAETLSGADMSELRGLGRRQPAPIWRAWVRPGARRPVSPGAVPPGPPKRQALVGDG